MASSEPLYIGFDLSTQQLKAIVVSSALAVVAEAKVDFDCDLARAYHVHKGVVAPPGTQEVLAPVAMWLEALDLVLSRLRDAGPDEGMLGRIKAISGACQQHGSVFWGQDAERLLGALRSDRDNEQGLKEKLQGSLAHEFAPNWQDSSTQKECDEFEAAVGGKEKLAEITGSSAHHRFTGPQILRLRKKLPDTYAGTSRICLVSSFLASVFLGTVAPPDISDACGMNLWDISRQEWNETLLSLVAGSSSELSSIRAKLGDVRSDGGGSLGTIAAYFVRKYGFSSSCAIVPFTGDNSATLLALPLRPGDAIVSIGTSTTFLTVTPRYRPSPAYHFFNHPTIPGQYMVMLCYKNGGLARETVRDALRREGETGKDAWQRFDQAILETRPLGVEDDNKAKMGLYFDLPEIVPNVPGGTWRFECNPDGSNLSPVVYPWPATHDARAIVESQCLSMRLRSQPLLDVPAGWPSLPPQPRRVYLAGGGSVNPVISRVVGEVLGGAEGVYRLDVGGNACALGGAYKAMWAVERGEKRFDELVGERWREEGAVEKVADGYTTGVWELYGSVVKAFGDMEREVLRETGRA